MKRFPWKKWVFTYSVTLIVGLYGVFVAKLFWNWLGVPILHVRSLSFGQVFCLMFLIGLFTRSGFPVNLKGEPGHIKTLEYALGLCIPEVKQEEWIDHLNDQGLLFIEVFAAVSGAFAWNTVLLALAAVIHLAMSA